MRVYLDMACTAMCNSSLFFHKSEISMNCVSDCITSAYIFVTRGIFSLFRASVFAPQTSPHVLSLPEFICSGCRQNTLIVHTLAPAISILLPSVIPFCSSSHKLRFKLTFAFVTRYANMCLLHHTLLGFHAVVKRLGTVSPYCSLPPTYALWVNVSSVYCNHDYFC